VGVDDTLKYVRELLAEGREITIINGKKEGQFEVASRKPEPPIQRGIGVTSRKVSRTTV
jgi:hypothetical protein